MTKPKIDRDLGEEAYEAWLDEEAKVAQAHYNDWCAAQGIAPSHGPDCDEDDPCAECRADQYADWIEEGRYR